MITEKLKELREGFYNTASPDVVEIIEKSITDLIHSNIQKTALNIGDKMPDFVLKNAVNENISLSGLLKKGPIIITFYRGAW